MAAYQREAAAQVPDTETPLTLEIKVADSSGEPIEGARVFVKLESENDDFQKEITTNDKGLAHTKIVRQGGYLIQVNAKGYKNYGKRYNINADQRRVKVELEQEIEK
jgi:hypothetical protein